MIKREMMDKAGVGHLLRSFHHIRVDRESGVQSMKDAMDYLKAGEVVGIYPEATISRSFEIKELKSGAVRIAADAGVPLIPVIVWGAHRLMTKDHPRDFSRSRKTIAVRVGAPMYPTGEDIAAETAALRAAMQRLLDETIAAYPEDEKAPGSWWTPARFGGSAPTLEEAAVLDKEELQPGPRKSARSAAKKGQVDQLIHRQVALAFVILSTKQGFRRSGPDFSVPLVRAMSVLPRVHDVDDPAEVVERCELDRDLALGSCRGRS